MAYQQIKLDTKGTYGAYDPETQQAVAFPSISDFQQYFTGQQPNSTAPLASFDTSALLAAPNRVLNVNQISPQPQINLPILQKPVDPLGAAVVNEAKSTSVSLQEYINQVTPTETEAERQQKAILQKIQETFPETLGRGQAQLQSEQEQNLPELKKQFADLNAQILAEVAGAEKLTADLEAGAGAKGLTTSILLGQQGAVARQKASSIALLQARAQGLLGQIEVAQATADRAIDLKYADAEDKIKLFRVQLESLQPILDKQEKIRAEALQRQYQDQQQKIADQKEKEKQIQNLMITAAQSGGDNQTLTRIQASQTVPEAIAAAGNILGAEYREKLKQQAFNNNIELQKLMIERSKASASGSLSETDLIAYAQQYAATGSIPTGLPKGTFGAVSLVAGSLPKAPGTIISSVTGVVPPSATFSAAQSDGVSGTYHLVKDVIPNLKSSFDNVLTNPGTGLFNLLRLRTKDVTEYNSQKTIFLNALLLANSGKVVSDSEMKRYQNLIPSLSTVRTGNGLRQLDALQKELTDKLNSYLANNQLAIVGYDPNDPLGLNMDIGNAANFNK